MNRYRITHTRERFLFLAELVGAAAAGCGIYAAVVLVFSLGAT